jgi:molybdenum cofactor synthesis domain-containing protein
MVKTAGIAIIGDEILSGKFADENARLLIDELRKLGVDLRRIVVIPDDLDEISATVRDLSERFDFVFTSGGVGPTHDDLTMEGIARAFGTRVIISPVVEKLLRDYWGESMPPANLRLAEVPEGAELVPEGAKWPAVKYRNVFILPGVPSLFRLKFESIRERFRGTALAERRLYFSEPEGNLAEHLDAVHAEFSAVKIGSYPRFGEANYKVMVTLESADPAALEAATSELRSRLAAALVECESGARERPDEKETAE